MLEDGNAEVAVALGVEIVEDGAVVCARRSASESRRAGNCLFFYHKILSALYKNPYKTTAVINICSIFVRKSKEIWRIHT